MCGIIGIASCQPLTNSSWVIAGRDALSHRGPDDAGDWSSTDGYVCFGHRRLSIIDLSSAGQQPMQDISRELSIVFNGEIYNFLELRRELSAKGHRFKSHSDTEVILAAYRQWDRNCLSHLNGMFAFVLYDSRHRKIFMARDRAGEKPLYYFLNKNTLRFSSELKGLLVDSSLPRRIDPEALDCYLSFGYVPGEMCILEGFKKLPPAHALSFNLETGSVDIWCYWQLPEYELLVTDGQVDEIQLLDELESLLEDAVHRQLVSDVPVGILLSGGVDSSLITAMAARSSSRVKTFTISFPGHGKYNEAEHARLIADHFGTDHNELEAEASSVDLLQELARQFDEPVIDSSIIPTYLVSRLVRQHCTVALGGDGGDELFGGYAHYSYMLGLMKKLGWVPQNLRWLIARAVENCFPVGYKGRNFFQRFEVDLGKRLPLMKSFFDPVARRHLLAGQERLSPVAECILNENTPQVTNFIERATRMDFKNYLAEAILVKVDRASMLNSLEIRAPLLDHHLVEFAYKKVPPYLKATVADRKILLKKLTNRLLPPEFDRQRKQGFAIPLASWLKFGSWQNFFEEVLLDSGNTLFNRNELESLLEGQKKGRSNSERLFGLVLFELWRQEYGATL